MNFQVPQFIEIEDKIFGPLSFRQFLYLIGGGGIAFLIYVIKIPLIIKIIPMGAVIAFALALAFYKVNQQPFILVVESAIKYYISNKLYLWKKETSKGKGKSQTVLPGVNPTETKISKMSESKLKDLTWSLDVQKNIK